MTELPDRIEHARAYGAAHDCKAMAERLIHAWCFGYPWLTHVTGARTNHGVVLRAILRGEVVPA